MSTGSYYLNQPEKALVLCADEKSHIQGLGVDQVPEDDWSGDAEGLSLHLIVDNYATHKHPKVKA